MRTRSILIAGVGGQGILRASDILCDVMLDSGLDVKKSEVHGMAQRGGCVTSHVRYGTKVFSPLAKKHDVDILVSFEKMDTLRYLDYLKDDGTVIINIEEIYPPLVNLGEALYPADVVQSVKRRYPIVKALNATEMATRAGNSRAANTVLLGVLSASLELRLESWEKALTAAFPGKLLAANRTAFHLGRSIC